MKHILPVLLACFLAICCNNPAPNTTSSVENNDSIALTDTPKERNYTEEVLATIPQNITPIMGYRFFVEGDFDGDGKKETLTEHLISGIDRKETNRFYNSIEDNVQLIALQDKKELYCFISCSKPAIDTFALGDKGDGQLLGLLLLRNEGDLNGDGTDEVSYIRHYADWSTLNSLHIITYTDSGWKDLYSVICYDGDAPQLFDFDIPKKNWERPVYINANTLKNYKSRIRKLKSGLIAVKSYGEGMAYETVDTVALPLKIR